MQGHNTDKETGQAGTHSDCSKTAVNNSNSNKNNESKKQHSRSHDGHSLDPSLMGFFRF